jgi:hypothetical protein
LQRALLPWGPGHPLATTGTGVLVYGRGCITDVSIIETTGSAAATATLHDATVDNMQVLRDWSLAAGGMSSEGRGHHWLPFEEGLYVHTLSGAVKGSITVWLEHDCKAWLVAPHQAAVLTEAEALASLGALPGTR